VWRSILGGEFGLGWVDALDLVNVCGVDGGREEAERHEIVVRGRDGVRMKREDGGGVAIFGEGEGFGLLVAVCGNGAALGESGCKAW
jgi:hypothetical protein